MMILQGKKHSYLVFGRRVVRHALYTTLCITIHLTVLMFIDTMDDEKFCLTRQEKKRGILNVSQIS